MVFRRKRLVIVKSGTPQALGAFQAALEQVRRCVLLFETVTLRRRWIRKEWI
jgi:hypothetical protein